MANETQFKAVLRSLLEDYPTELPDTIRVVDVAMEYKVVETTAGYAVQAYHFIREELGYGD